MKDSLQEHLKQQLSTLASSRTSERNRQIQQTNMSDIDSMLAERAAAQKAALSEQAPSGMAAAVGRRVTPGRDTGGAPLTSPTGNVGSWINQALHILKLDSSYAPGIANLIKHESGGNPNAINKWDSNWKAGHPSKGLMQTIDSTFRGNALPGYDKNIYDPVSNILAGIRYARNRYGDDMLRSGGRKNSAGKYIGY